MVEDQAVVGGMVSDDGMSGRGCAAPGKHVLGLFTQQQRVSHRTIGLCLLLLCLHQKLGESLRLPRPGWHKVFFEKKKYKRETDEVCACRYCSRSCYRLATSVLSHTLVLCLCGTL